MTVDFEKRLSIPQSLFLSLFFFFFFFYSPFPTIQNQTSSLTINSIFRLFFVFVLIFHATNFFFRKFPLPSLAKRTIFGVYYYANDFCNLEKRKVSVLSLQFMLTLDGKVRISLSCMPHTPHGL